MRKVLIGLGILLVLLIGGLAILPSLVPSSVYKEKIQTQLTKELERDVSIEGDVKLSVFPSIKAKTDRVVIANPDGFSDAPFAAMDGLEAKIKLLPLLSKRVEIAAFKLKTPQINLEKKTDGTSNWVFGDPEEVETPEPEEGPFKRDGRYANMDPAIGLFSIENGAISYTDATTQTNYNLKDVNLAFALPSLSKTVKIDGDVIFNDEPVTVNLSLDSPRNFLDGKTSPVSVALKTDFADISAKGEFLQSEAIAFNLNVDGDVNDMAKLMTYVPDDMPVSGIVNAAKLSGTYTYDGAVLSAKGADISAKGDTLDMAFKGNATLAETPVFDGTVSLNAQDIAKIAKLLELEVPGLDIAQSVNFTADLAAQGKGFAAENIDATLKGQDLDATFKGKGTFAETVSADGAFTANAGSIPALVKALKLDMPQAAALGNADVKGRVNMLGDAITLDIEIGKTAGQNLTASYTGKITKTGQALSANGTFDADIPSVSRLADIAKIEAPQAKALGALKVSGTVNHGGNATQLTGLSASTQGGILEGDYTGTATVGDTLALSGSFETVLKSLTNFATQTGMDIPYAASIGQVKAKGNLSGAGDKLSVSGLVVELSGGQLNGTFDGGASLNKGLNIDGTLNADIPSVRALASATGTQLPPSTKAGPIYENFNISGQVKGTPNDINFANASLALDHLKGKGDFAVDLTKAKPFITGTLNLGGLDLRPYMASYAAQNPTGEIQPWSEQPLNVAMLKAVDGDFTFTTPDIITDRMEMGQSNINATLRGGKMTAKLPKLNLYGGLGSVTAVIDGSSSTPTVALDVNMDDLNSNKFLDAVAGFTNVKGDGNTLLSVRGQGRTQAEIMKSLQGQGDFKLLNGEISGVDLATLMEGLDQALMSRSLPGGIGKQYTTKFKDIAGLFKIQNGVAKINRFNLEGFGVAAVGGGSIDLGRQNIDFTLRPRLTGESASNLASFGIPLKLEGKFGSVSAGLDTDMLGQIVAAQAKARLQKEITSKVGGPAGGILGGILGGGTPQPQTPTSQTQPATPQPGTEQAKPDPDQIVNDLFGSILGTKPKQPVTDPNAPAEGEKKEEEKKDPTIEDALLDLFGTKKKED